MTGLSLELLVSSRIVLGVKPFCGYLGPWLWQLLALQQDTQKSLRGLPVHTVANTERRWHTSLSGINRQGRHDGHSIVQRVKYLSPSVMPHR